MQKGKLKKEVEHCLQHFPETRNSDIELTIRIWETFYPEKLFEAPHNGNTSVEVRSLFDLPREDNVKRIRAKFTEQDKYLPTSWEVAEQRQIEEGRWRAYIRFWGIEDIKAPMIPPKVETCPHGLPKFVQCPNCRPAEG